MTAATLAVDLGGTRMRCAVVDPDGLLHHRQETATPHDGTGAAALVDLMRAVTSTVPCQRAVVGVPGRVNYRLGTLEHAPNLPFGWLPALTEAALAPAIGIPVALANDADLAAVGEATSGAGRPFADVAYLTLSTGVGAGVVLGGLLVHGRRSLAELGHTVIALDRLTQGQPATLEDLASGSALGRLATAAGIGSVGREVVARVEAGDPDAARVWSALVGAAAVGVVNLAWTFSPDVVIIGGGLGLVGDVLLDPLRVAVARDGPPAVQPEIEIVAAELGDDAGLVGAAGWQAAFVPEAAGRVPA
ncbi:MAG: ROK family protein [Acidimicrobiales bacterium]